MDARRRRQDPVARRGPDPRLGEGPSQLLGGARLTEHRRAQPAASALRAPPRVGGGAAPATGRWCRRPGERQRAGADRAPRRGPAALARQGERVARARRLHEHRPVAQACRAARRGPRAGSGPGVRVAFDARVGRPADPHREPLAEQVAGGGDLLRPARAEQVLGLHAAREATQERGRALALGAQQQRLAGVGVGRPRLGVEVVTVVPDRHQAEVVHRRERRAAGADHDPPGAARDRQEVAVAGGRTAVGGEHDVVVGTEDRGQRGVDPRDVLDVGRAHSAPRPPAAACAGGLREQPRPVVAGGGAPRPRAGLPPSRVLEVRGAACRDAPQAAAAASARHPGSASPGAEGCFSVVAWRGGTARRSTSERTPAYRWASAAASSAMAGLSTRSPLTTRRSGVSVPTCSVRSTRPRRTRRRPDRRNGP